MLLAGDIGGTKTILALFSAESGSNTPKALQSFPSNGYPNLEAMIEEFLQAHPAVVEAACFAVAGPVFNNKAKITNLSWAVDAENLSSTFGWRSVNIINDLESVAYAVPNLLPEDVYTLSEGKPVANGNISVIAPGTGLGEAYLTYSNGRYEAHASEGSHTSFGPLNAIEMDLLRYVREELGYEHVSYERVCSGALGIPNLYSFFKNSQALNEPAWLADKLAASEDPTPVIMEAALDKKNPCELCQQVLELFISILGAEAGNQALKIMATGGIYLGGGIPPRILSELKKPVLLNALRNHGRFKEMLTDVPVRVILNPQAGLIGAAAFGFDHS